MKYDFDTITDRKNTNSLKYDFAEKRGKPKDVLPLWVADMDFPAAPPIIEKLEAAVHHGIFGYSEALDPYFDAIRSWMLRHFHWEIQKDWLVKTPGVIFALAAAIRAFTRPGEGVMIQQPVYYPFSEVILDNDRTLVNCPLRLIDGHYEMDFEDMENKFRGGGIRLFLLCSPHNPVGRVWTEAELRKIGDLCLKYHVLVVSDEIHSDFVYPGFQHHVFAGLSPEYADITVTCTSPSKSFNLAGLQTSNIFISNKDLRRKFRKAVAAAGYSQLNQLGLVACQTAYESGEDWLNALKVYLWENLSFLRDFLSTRIPEVKLVEPEGTYLVWLDFRTLGLTCDELEDLIIRKAHLWLESGSMFGPDGKGFQRINIACPRATLQQALTQLESAVNTYHR
ncbi:MAG: MalY/PatB family protein [Anaerovoracaceae bacterium]